MAKAPVVSTKFTAIDRFSESIRKMTASASRFGTKMQASMARASRATRRLSTFTSNLTSKLFNLRNAAAVAVGAMAVKKIVDTAIGVAKMGDEASKTGRQIGITAESLQELRFAADRQGVSSETLTKSLQLLNRNVGDVQLGQGTLTTILKRSNPALLEQVKRVKTNEEAFDLLTKAISDAPNQLQKVALASAAFGRSGQDMLKLLEAGPEGLSKLRQEARNFGGVISNESAAAMEKFIDVQTNIKFALQGLKITIGTELIPVIEDVMKKLTGWIMANKELIKVKVSEFITKIIEKAIWVRDNFDRISQIIKIVAIAFGTLIAVTTTLNTVMAISNAIMAANPVGLIILAIAALASGIVYLITHWSDLVNWIKTSDNWFAKITRGTINALVNAFKAVGKAISWVVDLFKKVWEWIKKIASGAFAPIQKIMSLFNGKKSELDVNMNQGQQALNPDATVEQVRTERIEKTSNEKMRLQVEAANGTKATILEDPNSMIQLTPTLGWQ